MSARVSKFAYGIDIYRKFDASNTEHRCRKKATFITPEGYLGIDGIFSVILPKVRDAQRSTALILIISYVQNTKVSETQKFSRCYYRTASEKSLLETISVSIKSYRGDSTDSEKWMDKEKCKIPCYFLIIKRT